MPNLSGPLPAQREHPWWKRREFWFFIFPFLLLGFFVLYRSGWFGSGERSWRETKAAFAAKGVSLNYKDYGLPKKTPEKEDFFAALCFQPSEDSQMLDLWKRVVVGRLEAAIGMKPVWPVNENGEWPISTPYAGTTPSIEVRWDALAEELAPYEDYLQKTVADLAARPGFSSGAFDDAGAARHEWARMTTRLSTLRLALNLDGLLAVHRADRARALADLLATARVAQAVYEMRPSALGATGEAHSYHEYFLPLFAAGQISQIWSAEDYAAIQAALAKVSLVADYLRGMDVETARTVSKFESDFPALARAIRQKPYGEWDTQLKANVLNARIHLMSRSGLWENLVNFVNDIQLYKTPFDSATGRVDTAAFDKNAVALNTIFAGTHPSRALSNQRMLAAGYHEDTGLGSIGGFAEIRSLAETSAWLRMAETVCAIERYRAEHGSYPAALADLSPALMTKSPADPFTGNPLVYRVIPGGRFELYSAGWNQIDDGGHSDDLIWPQTYSVFAPKRP